MNESTGCRSVACCYQDHSCCTIWVVVSNMWLLQSRSIHDFGRFVELPRLYAIGRTGFLICYQLALFFKEMSLIFLQYSEKVRVCGIETKMRLALRRIRLLL